MHAITRRGFNRATSRDARKWNELEWDFHWFPIIRTDRIIDRNALSDSISASFGAEIEYDVHCHYSIDSRVFLIVSSDTVSSFTLKRFAISEAPRSLNAENRNAERECKHETDDLIEPGHATP